MTVLQYRGSREQKGPFAETAVSEYDQPVAMRCRPSSKAVRQP